MVKPKGERANSWQDVADISATFGISLDPWQELILEAAMGERSDRTWAAKRVGVSVPRQNGKSQLLVARALAGALLFGEKKIVVSAHQQDTAREAFTKLLEIIEKDGNEALRDRLDPRFGRSGVMNALNREAVRFTNGATIQFKARSGAAGKGFSSDCLLLDEAQILGSRAWTSINSTMSAMRNPQVWLLGTPPQEEDDSYTFEMVRKSALNGKSTAAAWCEWSADPEAEDYDPASEYTRWSANPAWLTRINSEVVQGEYETYSADRFAQDRLGIWRGEAELRRAIDLTVWSARVVKVPPIGKPDYFSLSISPERIGYIGVAIRGDEADFVDLAEAGRVDDSRKLVEWFSERRPCTVAIDGRDPAAALVNELRAAKVKVNVTTQTDASRASVGLAEAIAESRLEHVDQPAVREALLVARKKLVGKAGLWEFDPDDDIAALRAITLARYGLTFKKKRTGDGRNYGGDRRTSNRRAGVVL